MMGVFQPLLQGFLPAVELMDGQQKSIEGSGQGE